MKWSVVEVKDKKNQKKNSRPILRKIMVVAILLARGQRDMLKTIFGEQ